MKVLLSLLIATEVTALAPTASTRSQCGESLWIQCPDISRRSWLVRTSSLAFGAAVVLPRTAAAAAVTVDDKFQTYQNSVCGFQIDIPIAWEKTSQKLPDRRVLTMFIDPTSGVDEEKTLFFYAKTPVRDDFTSLGSFGSVERVAQSVILPQGELAGQAIPSEMILAESKKNAYFFDYKVTPPGQAETHYRAIFSLANGATGGAGSILVTLTIQTPESRYAEMKPLFDKMVDSYGKYVAES